MYVRTMSKTIQIRDVSEETYRRLVQRAAEVGMSVPEFLRREADKLAKGLSPREWQERVRASAGPTRDLRTVESLDELRGSWPT